MVEGTFRDNTEQQRYEFTFDGGMAYIDYILTGKGVRYLTHTEVPVEFEGRGIASHIIKEALMDIEKNEEQLFPLCPFVLGYLERHPEWKKLLA